jgi:heptosyltransferase II
VAATVQQSHVIEPGPDSPSASPLPRKPLRLLVVLPSWVGDAVMATPALRLLRSGLPGAFIGGLMRPGIDELLAGTDLLDEFHVDRARGMMGPKLAANKLRPRRYDTALLLANSFSTALITRLAFIPRRIGYDRDARGLLLTDKLRPERKGALGLGAFACISAVEYYLNAARAVFDVGASGVGANESRRTSPGLELAISPAQEQAGAELLRRADVREGVRYAVLNPGANNPAKRWPAERFAAVGAHLALRHDLSVLVNGGPGEQELAETVVGSAVAIGVPSGRVVNLAKLGMTLGALKPIVRGAAVMLTNDTGPRHVAAALNVPVVTLFGPTDPRWTTLPVSSEDGQTNVEIVADPTLPPDMLADEHPERCRIDRIEIEGVVRAIDGVLGMKNG